MEDRALLKSYAEHQDQAAFAQLAQRHGPWLLAAARRQLRDDHLAEDVTQAVFLLLARRARGLAGYAYLSGWLFATLSYCMKHARRQRARMERREREAAVMRRESVHEASWDDVAPLLETVLGRLRKADRDAILLRFYEHKPLAEVGRLMGTSEEAARKRVNRSLEKLRGMLAKQGVTAGAAALGVIMTEKVTEAAGPITPSLILPQGGGDLAAVIAKGAIRMMAWAKVKVAAVILLALTAATGVGVWASAPAPAPVQKSGSARTSASPVVVTQENDETKVAGRVQLARWDVILNDAGAEAIRKLGNAVDTPSKQFQAMTFKGSDLRAAIREATKSGGVERTSTEMDILDDWGVDSSQITCPTGLDYSHYASDDGERVMILGGSSFTETHDRLPGNRLKVKLNHVMDLGVNELTNRWRNKQYKGTAIVYDGELSAGQALAFLGKFAGQSGEPYWLMTVWETFVAQPEQMHCFMATRNAAWWCENGPAKVRQWADISRVWISSAAHEPSVVAKEFERTLEDGKKARLVALCRPSKWPYCWWDAQGNPVGGFDGMLPFYQGNPPKGLYAIVQVEGKREEFTLAQPSGDSFVPAPAEKFQRPETLRVREGRQPALEVGVLVGPWRELAKMKLEDQVQVAGVEYRTSRASAFNPSDFLIHFERTGILEQEDCLLPASADGAVAHTSHRIPIVVQDRNRQPQHVEEQPNFHGLPLQKVAELRLMQRKRQWLTFDGFATEPRTAPPLAAPAEDVLAAEKRIEQGKLDAIHAERAKWRSLPADSKTPEAAIRTLLKAVVDGDVAAARATLKTDTPAGAQLADAMVRVPIKQRKLFALACQQFGELQVLERLRGNGLINDVESDWQDLKLRSLPDGSAEFEGISIRKDADGLYRLGLDSIAKDAGAMQQMQRLEGETDRLTKLLLENPHMAVDDFRTVLNTPCGTTRP